MRNGVDFSRCERDGLRWNLTLQSMSGVLWLVEKSHLQQNKYFNRPNAAPPSKLHSKC